MEGQDGEILRLNQKIKQLIWRNDQNMSRNSQLEAENKRLSVKVEEMKEICTLTSTLNVKYKTQLEQETEEKTVLKDVNRKMKLKLNFLTAQCNELNEKVKVLETNLNRKPVTRMSQNVQIIRSISDITRNPALDDLQRRYNELEAEHQEALHMIEDLEFELGDIDYLEMETQRLQEENEELKEMLRQAGISTSHGQDINRTGNNLSNLTLKDESNEEARDESDFAHELQSIHARKMNLQEKLKQFHHRCDGAHSGN